MPWGPGLPGSAGAALIPTGYQGSWHKGPREAAELSWAGMSTLMDGLAGIHRCVRGDQRWGFSFLLKSLVFLQQRHHEGSH